MDEGEERLCQPDDQLQRVRWSPEVLRKIHIWFFFVIISQNLEKYDHSNTGMDVVASLTAAASRVLNCPHDPPRPSSPQRFSIKPVFGPVALLFAYSPFQPLSNVIWAPSVHMMSAAAWLTTSPLQTKGSRFSSPRLAIVSLCRLPL